MKSVCATSPKKKKIKIFLVPLSTLSEMKNTARVESPIVISFCVALTECRYSHAHINNK